MLSQRTREENTHNASRQLFSEYDSPKELAEAPIEHIKELTRCAGFSNSKPEAIKDISKMIVEEYGGEVPRDIDQLLEFPLVGRKTANCVLAYAFGIDAICVDTHVHRISNRIGVVDTDSPDETEYRLKEVVPKRRWKEINSLMVVFGRLICRPRNPKCTECPISGHCDYFLTEE